MGPGMRKVPRFFISCRVSVLRKVPCLLVAHMARTIVEAWSPKGVISEKK